MGPLGAPLIVRAGPVLRRSGGCEVVSKGRSHTTPQPECNEDPVFVP